jgi:hypothetical protein
MVEQTFSKLKYFLLYFCAWIIIFSVIFKTLEVSYSDEDYLDMNLNLITLFQTYRNSIGDIAAPDYSKWIDDLPDEEDSFNK